MAPSEEMMIQRRNRVGKNETEKLKETERK
jgi:hypothetical protein